MAEAPVSVGAVAMRRPDEVNIIIAAARFGQRDRGGALGPGAGGYVIDTETPT